VRVMQFEAGLLATIIGRRAWLALGVLAVAEPDPLADVAARGRPVQPAVVVEVRVMRVVLTGRMGREVHQVVMRFRLLVRGNEARKRHKPPRLTLAQTARPSAFTSMRQDGDGDGDAEGGGDGDAGGVVAGGVDRGGTVCDPPGCCDAVCGACGAGVFAADDDPAPKSAASTGPADCAPDGPGDDRGDADAPGRGVVRTTGARRARDGVLLLPCAGGWLAASGGLGGGPLCCVISVTASTPPAPNATAIADDAAL
jgi:hypothetical protein